MPHLGAQQRACQLLAITGRVIALAALMAIALLTLTPGQSRGPVNPGFLLGPPGATDIIYNVALFVPLGLGLRLAGRRVSWIILGSAALSTTIEFIQWHWIPTRYSSLADIVANTIGAAAGALAVAAVPRLARPSRRVAGIAAALAALAWIFVNLVGASLLRLDIPVTPIWYGQWARTFTTTVPLSGSVLSVTANGLQVPDDSLNDTRALQHLAAKEGIHLVIRAIDLSRVSGRAQVAAIADGRGNLVTAVEQQGCTLRLVDRRRGEQLGLKMLTLNLEDGCSTSTDTVTIDARSTSGGMAIALQRGNTLRGDTLPVTPAEAWRLLAISPRRAGQPSGWALAWIAAFMLPLAYWTKRAAARPGARHLAGICVLAIAAMVAAAWLCGLAFPSLMEMAGLTGALVLGWWGPGRVHTGVRDEVQDTLCP